ncbi:helix-turn-helix transcriptional regulator [Actinophytocola sp.]|uniref:ArsR/SmtB family transcription factor n=1 Tax=Actinophytocola sp. TaxID=1872138 RepID=UPI0025BBDE1D|nr:metalloregulator ArsR/SmtB family transcription factor [Actinophytocola sp.]
MTAVTDYSADLDETAALLHAVADPVRLYVLRRLAERPACVCTLLEHLPVAVNLLSYHLKVLREAGLVTCSRRGRWIDYALAADALDRLHAALPSPPNPSPTTAHSPRGTC